MLYYVSSIVDIGTTKTSWCPGNDVKIIPIWAVIWPCFEHRSWCVGVHAVILYRHSRLLTVVVFITCAERSIGFILFLFIKKTLYVIIIYSKWTWINVCLLLPLLRTQVSQLLCNGVRTVCVSVCVLSLHKSAHCDIIGADSIFAWPSPDPLAGRLHIWPCLCDITMTTQQTPYLGMPAWHHYDETGSKSTSVIPWFRLSVTAAQIAHCDIQVRASLFSV